MTNIIPADERLRQQRNYTRVPNELIEHNELSMQAKMVWIELWKYCYHDGDSAFPGMGTLAQNLNTSEKTARKYRKELEDNNLLKTERRGLQKTNLYYLYAPEPNPSSFQEPNPSSDKEDKVVKEDEVNNNKTLSEQKDKYNNNAPVTARGLDYEEIKETWNEGVPEPLEIRSITPKRKKKLKARFKEEPFDLDEIVVALNEQPFCYGENDRNWKADFSWIIKNSDNYVKVLERNYSNGGRGSVSKDGSIDDLKSQFGGE